MAGLSIEHTDCRLGATKWGCELATPKPSPVRESSLREGVAWPLKTALYADSPKIQIEIHNFLSNRLTEGTNGSITFELLYFISFVFISFLRITLFQHYVHRKSLNSKKRTIISRLQLWFSGEVLQIFQPFSVVSKPDRLETIQSHRFSCVDGRSAHQYRSQREFKFRPFLKNFATEILVLNQEKLVSGFWFWQKWIRHEKLPLTWNF